jgi:hypothetical protein
VAAGAPVVAEQSPRRHLELEAQEAAAPLVVVHLAQLLNGDSAEEVDGPAEPFV